MNEEHKEFFRELSEICKKFNATILVDYRASHRVQFTLGKAGKDQEVYYAYFFSKQIGKVEKYDSVSFLK